MGQRTVFPNRYVCHTTYKPEALLHKTFVRIETNAEEVMDDGSVVLHEVDEILFVTDNGEQYVMHHGQDCCEYVRLIDTAGDMADLIGQPLLQCEQATNNDNPPERANDSFTWSFFKLATIKGSVTLRWLGESNGYYGEEVQITRIADVGAEDAHV